LVKALLRQRAVAALTENQSKILNAVNGSWTRYNRMKLATAAAIIKNALDTICRFLAMSGVTKKYMSAVMTTMPGNRELIGLSPSCICPVKMPGLYYRI
jgi:hypothetical protein